MDKASLSCELEALRPVLHQMNFEYAKGQLDDEDDPDAAATRDWHQAIMDRVVWLKAKIDEK